MPENYYDGTEDYSADSETEFTGDILTVLSEAAERDSRRYTKRLD